MAAMFTLSVLALLSIAAWRDIATRTIPDTVCVLIAALGILLRASHGVWALVVSVEAALLLFILLLILFVRGLIGGGDVKIMTALAIALPPFDSYRFVVFTVMAGGVLGIAYLLLSFRPRRASGRNRTSLLGRIAAIESRRIGRRGPLPYGVAIAVGGGFVLLFPWTL